MKWLKYKLFLILLSVAFGGGVAFFVSAASGGDITTDPLVQQQTNRTNWEPGGSYFPGNFSNRGSIIERGGNVTTTLTTNVNVGGWSLQNVTISGQYTYTIDLTSYHPHWVHSPFSVSSSASDSVSASGSDRQVTVNMSWNGVMNHPANGYDGSQGGGYPAPVGAIDLYTFDITGNASGSYFLPPQLQQQGENSNERFNPLTYLKQPVNNDINRPVGGRTNPGSGLTQIYQTGQSSVDLTIQQNRNPTGYLQTEQQRLGTIGYDGTIYFSSDPNNPYQDKHPHAKIERIAHSYVYTLGKELKAKKIKKDSKTISSMERDGLKLLDAFAESGKEGEQEGFVGMVVKDTKTGDIIIAFRGTDKEEWKDRKDILLGLGWGEIGRRQYERNSERLKEWAKKYKDAKVTGHSMGGGIAQIYAAEHPDATSEVILFQSTRVSSDTAEEFEEIESGKPKVTIYKATRKIEWDPDSAQRYTTPSSIIGGDKPIAADKIFGVGKTYIGSTSKDTDQFKIVEIEGGTHSSLLLQTKTPTPYENTNSTQNMNRHLYHPLSSYIR